MATNSIIDSTKNWFNGLSPNGKMLVVVGGIVVCCLVLHRIQEHRRHRYDDVYAMLDYVASQGSSINTNISAGDQNMPQPGVYY